MYSSDKLLNLYHLFLLQNLKTKPPRKLTVITACLRKFLSQSEQYFFFNKAESWGLVLIRKHDLLMYKFLTGKLHQSQEFLCKSFVQFREEILGVKFLKIVPSMKPRKGADVPFLTLEPPQYSLFSLSSLAGKLYRRLNIHWTNTKKTQTL